MSRLFTRSPEPDNAVLEEIRGLRRELASLKGERDAVTEATRLMNERDGLKQQIADLKVDKSRVTEQHEREKREVEHMVGLEKKRSEVEMEQAKREAVLVVREENLKADRDRFEEQMKFTTARFEQELKYQHELMGEILKRLPAITVEKAIDLEYGRRNGKAEEEAVA